jgi:hypothetical protein
MTDSMAALGNFKGVMLCNRPAQIPGSLQTIVGPTATSGPTRPAFVSAVTPEGQLGLPPIRQQRVQARADPAANRENDVTWRHKRWLNDFAERRAAISYSMEARVAEQSERARRFAERNQAMRDAIRGIKADTLTDRDGKAVAIEAALHASSRPRFVPTEYVEVSQQYPTGAPITHYPEEQQQSSPPPPAAAASSDAFASPVPVAPAAQPSSRATSKPTKGSAASNKPGWARTAAEEDDYLDVEADQLLEFASGLNYQEYIDDLEVREAIKFVQQRVAGLEASKQTAEAHGEEQRKMIDAGELEEVWVIDDTKPADPVTGEPALKRVVRRPKRSAKQAQTLADTEGSGAGAEQQQQSEQDRAAQQDALSRTVLDSNRAIRNVHSSASVRAIMEKEQKQQQSSPSAPAYSATTLRRNQLATVPDDEPYKPPVISTIRAGDQGSPRKVLPSNLPFLYRHPGI